MTFFNKEWSIFMALKDEFTLDNVYSYVQACVDIAHYLSVLNAEGRTSIVLPSRGSFPVYKTADHIREYLGHIPHNWLLLPFTADSSQNVSSDVARRHWVKVLAAESTGKPNKHWGFFRANEAKLLRRDPPLRPFSIGPFTMIDTAISGQAATEILGALDDEHLDYHLLLLVDEMGKKLRPEYRRVIETNKRVTLIPVKSLYTEDRGCAMMGITTALFPTLTNEDFVMSMTLELPFKRLLWQNGIKIEKLSSASEFYSYLHAMHFYASKVCLGVPFENDDQAVVEWFLNVLSNNLNLVNPESTIAACQSLVAWGKMDVTSSMAVRVYTNQ
jgi:hypothetical protein